MCPHFVYLGFGLEVKGYGLGVGIRIKVSGLIYMGGCQNYGPFLGPYYNTAASI